MICPFCSKINDPDSKFCRNCGFDIKSYSGLNYTFIPNNLLSRSFSRYKEVLFLPSINSCIVEYGKGLHKLVDIDGNTIRELGKLYSFQTIERIRDHHIRTLEKGYFLDSIWEHGNRFLAESFVLVENNDNVCFLDISTGHMLYTPNVRFAKNFYNGLAKVEGRENLKTGFINKKGDVVIPMKFDDAKEFNFGYAPVRINDRWGIINDKGQIVVKAEYGWINNITVSGYFKAVKSSWGIFPSYYNLNGEKIPEKVFMEDVYKSLSLIIARIKEENIFELSLNKI